MTEQEKMLSGKLYSPGDETLAQMRQDAKVLLHTFNTLSPDEWEQKEALLETLFGTVGKSAWIEQPLRCDYGCNIHVGENLYINYNCVILDCATVTIGDNVMFAPNVSLFTAGHPLDAQQRLSGIEFAYPITIGNNVWIGGGSIINPGVTIGDNTVIGSGSVVTKDIPANVVAVGNPCRVLRAITEADKMIG